MDRIGSANWAKFKALIRDGNDTFNQVPVVWYRSKGGLDRHGEDNETERFEQIILKGLFVFNYFRTWPVNENTETGQIDRQSKMLLLNKAYLRENNWLNGNDRLDYDPAADKFEYKGEFYKDRGYTEVSQAFDDELMIAIVLKEEEKLTGTT